MIELPEGSDTLGTVPYLTPREGKTGESPRSPGSFRVMRVVSLFALLVSAAARGFADTPTAARPEDSPEIEWIVGTSSDTAPYSYYENGAPKGFAVDLLDAIAREMNLRLRRIPIRNSDLPDLFRERKVDVAQLWTETKARKEAADFSVPFLVLQLVVVVRNDDHRIRTLDDLRGLQVATGTKNSVASEFLSQQYPAARMLNSASADEVLPLLASGGCDAALVTRLTALTRIERHGITNLRLLDLNITGYDVRDSFAVRHGETELLSRLNEGLAIIRESGEYTEIYNRWFSFREPRRFTRAELMNYGAAVLAVALVVVGFAFFRQRRLSRQIAQQATELRNARTLQAALFENHPLATCVLTRSPAAAAQLVSLNLEAAKLTGLDPALALPRSVDSLSLPAEIRRYFDDIIARWPAHSATTHHEHYLAETRRLLETTLVPLDVDEAGAAHLCVLSADVTRRRLDDQEIAQSRRLRALGELVGGIAHEFNNLLTPVLMQTGLLREDRQADAALVAELKLIEDATRRSAALTQRLLAFGRRGEDAPGTVQLEAALASCIALLRPGLDRRVTLHVNIPAGLPPVLIDPTDFHQIAFNLLINARDALLEYQGRPATDPAWVPSLALTVQSLPAGAHLPREPRPGATLAGWQRLTVADNGPGIPPEVQERIFEPFFTTKEVGKGTGLGLATVWHLVQEAGGIIDVDSRPGEGARFHVTLPVWKSLAPTAPAAGEPTATVLPPSGPVQKVLVVEDEELIATAALSLLRRLGHDARHVTDGVAAQQALLTPEAKFDLLLVDINMPRLSGVDFVKQVRATSFPGRIVMMSGRVSEADRRALERARVDRILAKPFTIETLAEALQAAD